MKAYNTKKAPLRIYACPKPGKSNERKTASHESLLKALCVSNSPVLPLFATLNASTHAKTGRIIEPQSLMASDGIIEHFVDIKEASQKM